MASQSRHPGAHVGQIPEKFPGPEANFGEFSGSSSLCPEADPGGKLGNQEFPKDWIWECWRRPFAIHGKIQIPGESRRMDTEIQDIPDSIPCILLDASFQEKPWNPPPGQGWEARIGISRDIKEEFRGKVSTAEKSSLGMFG